MATENIYAPPESNLINTASSNELLSSLHRYSTWLLVLLTFVTLGVYGAHYIKRQTVVINSFLHDNDKLGLSAPNTLLFISYLSLALSLLPFATLNMDQSISSSIELAGSIVSLIWTLMMLVLCFKMRTKLHSLLNSLPGGISWFHGFWTFFFQIYYINYKINTLNKAYR